MAKRAKNLSAKIFILDTSVILYDHDAFLNFHEHDVALPIQVLEELDNFKGGSETRSVEARGFIRLLENMSQQKLLNEWVSLPHTGGRFTVIMDHKPAALDAEELFGNDKVDHRILNAALFLQEKNPSRKVILVSKDICLRLKAKSLNIHAEDYETGKVKNVDDLYSGLTVLNNIPDRQISELKKKGAIGADTFAEINPKKNYYYRLKNGRSSALAFYNSSKNALESVPAYTVFNISPRNPEQNCAMHALLDPDIKLVTILGNAGTGKTLLAAACALELRRNYRQIYVTRPVVPLSNKEIGFLPGDVKSKIDPYMAPIWDNLKYIKEQNSTDEKVQAKIDELVENGKIAVTPLAFIRGRSLSKIFFIVDEAQNLTPHEVKTIISRAGPDTKIVFTGDIYQIDTPYLDEESNGLSYLIDKAQNHPLYAHITLHKGERSPLASLATDLL